MRFLATICACVLLTGCGATVSSTSPDGTQHNAKIPWGYDIPVGVGMATPNKFLIETGKVVVVNAAPSVAAMAIDVIAKQANKPAP